MGGVVADFLICFACDEFQRHWKGTDLYEDFDPARERLLALFVQVFPNDRALKRLKKR